MAFSIQGTGYGGRRFSRLLTRYAASNPSECLALAVAYGSVQGVDFIADLASQNDVGKVAWVTDIRDRVTHPEALRRAQSEGWDLRVVNRPQGTFHPKLYVGCDDIDGGQISDVKWVAQSSANLSAGALRRNVEASFFGTGPNYHTQVRTTFQDLWDLGTEIDNAGIDQYEIDFYAKNRKRDPQDQVMLGVADVPGSALQPTRTTTAPANRLAAGSPKGARVAWAGLESFTGEYRLQLEFPRSAGEVLSNLLSGAGNSGRLNMRCSDGISRPMTYRFYPDNSMFRLNIPNDAPNADWARIHRAGIGLVDADVPPGTDPKFEILIPGPALNAVVARSAALGTWGKTPTRLYGWF